TYYKTSSTKSHKPSRVYFFFIHRFKPAFSITLPNKSVLLKKWQVLPASTLQINIETVLAPSSRLSSRIPDNKKTIDDLPGKKFHVTRKTLLQAQATTRVQQQTKRIRRK